MLVIEYYRVEINPKIDSEICRKQAFKLDFVGDAQPNYFI